MLQAEIPKWRKTIAISLSRFMAYKIDFFLTLVAPSLVFVLINYNIWRAIYRYQGENAIGGLSAEEMLRYQCWVFIVTLLARSHRSWNLSEDIRYGRITPFLLYPFQVWKYHACEFIAFQIIQMVIVVLAVVVLLFGGFLSALDPLVFGKGILFATMVSALWFSLEFGFGLVGFWLEEVWILRVIFQLFAVLLSGAFIPIELFPDMVQKLLVYTPFPLITSIPVHIFLETPGVSFWGATGTLCVWFVISACISTTVWKRGIKRYVAAGM